MRGESRPAKAGRYAARYLLGALALAMCGCSPKGPPLPDLSSATSAVRTHLQDERASGLEGYCLALHADMFLDQADRCYRELEKRDTSNWRWTYYRALILDENGGGPAAIETLRDVTSKARDFGPAWWRLGDAYFKAGDYDAAADAWQHAVAADEPPRGADSPAHVVDVRLSAYARFGLARIRLLKGDTQGAHQLLEQAIASAPRFGPAFRLLGDQTKADRLPPYAPYADPMIDTLAHMSRNSAFLLRQASDADLATNAAWSEFLLRRALGFDPDNPDVLSKLGRTLRTLGRNEEAYEFLKAYHDKVPGDLLGLAQLASCLTALRQFNDAEPMLRQVIAGLDDAQTHYNLGVVLGATDRVGEAIEEYRKALQRDPLLFDAGNNLAAAYARLGKMPEAAAELRKVLAADPDNAMARANLQLIERSGAPPSRPLVPR